MFFNDLQRHWCCPKRKQIFKMLFSDWSAIQKWIVFLRTDTMRQGDFLKLISLLVKVKANKR